MAIKTHGIHRSEGFVQQTLPFANATEAGWSRNVSGQAPMIDGETTDSGIVSQAHTAIRNVIRFRGDAGHVMVYVLRAGARPDDLPYFESFKKVFVEYFGENPPARLSRVKYSRRPHE